MVCFLKMPRLLATAFALIGLAGMAHAQSAVINPQEILLRSDVAAPAPSSFRARLALKRLPSPARHEVEVWRSGDAKTLVRFLDAKERGKYLLRLDGELWLLAPGAREPVHLGPSHRLYGGATLDEVLGSRLARDYLADAASEGKDATGPTIVLELRAKSERMLFQSVRYVVRRDTNRPTRAEYHLRSGRAATAVEFVEWSDKGLLYARRVIVRDLLRNGTPTEVEVLDFEERVAPNALFDLRNSGARTALAAEKLAVP